MNQKALSKLSYGIGYLEGLAMGVALNDQNQERRIEGLEFIQEAGMEIKEILTEMMGDTGNES